MHSTPDSQKFRPGDACWATLTALVQELEISWAAGSPTPIADLLPANADGQRRRILVELIKVDQELSWTAGRKVGLEVYVAQWPELASDADVLLELLHSECLTRAAFGGLPTQSELASRFPSLAPQIDLQRIAAQAKDEAAAPHRFPLEDEVSADKSESFADERSPKQPLKVGELFGRYRIQSQLGEGGMGCVYLALDTQLLRDVALKLPHLSAGHDEVAIARFLRESRAAARIEHPNVCPIYDAGELEGKYFISMRRVRGTSLAKHLENGPLSPLEAAQTAHKLASALSAVHSHGILHRDVKASNILLDENGEPLLTDFGLARFPDAGEPVTPPESTDNACRDDNNHITAESVTGRVTNTLSSQFTGSLVGTVHYLAPELLAGHAPDERSDIYSLGVVLYRMLTGRLPFPGQPHEALAAIESGTLRPPRDFVRDISGELEAVCLRSLARDPNSRYQSAAEFAAALRTYINPTERKQQELRVKKVRTKMRLACGIGIVSLVAAIIAMVGDGTLVIRPIDEGVRIFIDGDEIPIPLTNRDVTMPLSFGTHTVEVFGATFEKRVHPVNVYRRGYTCEISATATLAQTTPDQVDKGVASMCGTADGKYIYATFSNLPDISPVKKYDAETGEMLESIPFPDESFDHRGSALSHDEQILFVTNFHKGAGDYNHPISYDHDDISCIDLLNKNRRTDQKVGGFWSTDVAATTDGRLVLCRGGDNRVTDEHNDALCVFDITGGRFDEIVSLRQSLVDEPISGTLVLSPDGRFAYFLTRPRTSLHPRLYEVPLTFESAAIRYCEFPHGDLRSLAFSPQLHRLFVVDANQIGQVQIVDANSLTAIPNETIQIPQEYLVEGICLHPRSELLAILCCTSRTIYVYDPRHQQVTARLSKLPPLTAVASFSPDGNRLWVSHSYPRGAISVLDLGRHTRQPTVVFTSNRDGEGQRLYRMNGDGTGVMPLAVHHGSDSSPHWSPDGKRIAFVSTRNGAPRIFISNEFGGGVRCLTDTNPDAVSDRSAIAWSGDGTRIVFLAGAGKNIAIVDEQTGAVAPMKTTGFPEEYAYLAGVDWDHTSGDIFVVAQAPDSGIKKHDIFRINANTGQVTQVTHHRGGEFSLLSPAVAPDGKRLAAVISHRVDNPSDRPIRIIRLSDGSCEVDLNIPGYPFCRTPRWATDGRSLVFAASRHDSGTYEIFRFSIAEAKVERLTCNSGDDLAPDVNQ